MISNLLPEEQVAISLVDPCEFDVVNVLSAKLVSVTSRETSLNEILDAISKMKQRQKYDHSCGEQYFIAARQMFFSLRPCFPISNLLLLF